MMQLSQALAQVKENSGRDALRPLRLHLAMGSTASHLAAFVTAYAAQESPDRHIVCTTGPYGDVIGALASPIHEGL